MFNNKKHEERSRRRRRGEGRREGHIACATYLVTLSRLLFQENSLLLFSLLFPRVSDGKSKELNVHEAWRLQSLYTRGSLVMRYTPPRFVVKVQELSSDSGSISSNGKYIYIYIYTHAPYVHIYISRRDKIS